MSNVFSSNWQVYFNRIERKKKKRLFIEFGGEKKEKVFFREC
jgi:hypothetical protein